MHLCCERFLRVCYLLGRWTKPVGWSPHSTLQRSAGDAFSKSHLSCTLGHFSGTAAYVDFGWARARKSGSTIDKLNSLENFAKRHTCSTLRSLRYFDSRTHRPFSRCFHYFKMYPHRFVSKKVAVVCLLCSAGSLHSLWLTLCAFLTAPCVAVTGVQSSLWHYGWRITRKARS